MATVLVLGGHCVVVAFATYFFDARRLRRRNASPPHAYRRTLHAVKTGRPQNSKNSYKLNHTNLLPKKIIYLKVYMDIQSYICSKL